MGPNLKNLLIDLSNIDTNRLLENWTWLIGADKETVLVTSIGDMFLKDNQEHVYWLNVGEGYIEKVADNLSSFNDKLLDAEQVNEWFLTQLVEDIHQSGLRLTPKKLFSYKKLPIIGGDYKADNFELMDIITHFQLTGEIHKQLADLPEGTLVNVKFTE